MECTQVSNEEAYKLYLEASPTLQARSKKCQTAAIAFIARYGIDEGERKNLTLKFSRLVDSRATMQKFSCILEPKGVLRFETGNKSTPKDGRKTRYQIM